MKIKSTTGYYNRTKYKPMNKKVLNYIFVKLCILLRNYNVPINLSLQYGKMRSSEYFISKPNFYICAITQSTPLGNYKHLSNII